jgi:Fe-S-cluster containining protein
MALKTDRNGIFIYGMTNTDELAGFLKHKFSEPQIQQAYEYLVEASENRAREEKMSPLRAFWEHLKKIYNEGVPPLQCHRGCSHCCHTGVSCTQLEWDGILKNVKEKSIDLNAIFQRSKRSIDKVEQVLKLGEDFDQVDWHKLVINQPCPFLNEEGACEVYEDRPLDCRMVVAFRGVCESKKLEHAQRGVVLEEAVGATVIAKLQHDMTPKIKRRKFRGTQPINLLQHWLILWKKKNS